MEKILRNKVFDKVLSHKSLAILIHTSPDADAVGSGLAMQKALEKKNIKSEVFCNDFIPKEYRFMSGWHRIKNKLDTDAEAMLVLDTGGEEKIGFKNFRKFSVPVYSIDHHIQSNRYYIDAYVDPDVSSTSEIIYDLFIDYGLEIDKDMANCLLAGIIYDTQYFQHTTVSDKLFCIASDLVGKGARLPKINSHMNEKRSVEVLRLWGRIIERMKFDRDLGFTSTAILSEDTKAMGDDLSGLKGLSSLLNSINGSSASVILKEDEKGTIQGSLRSDEFKHPNINVADIANEFGGGGHKYASGFRKKGKVVETKSNWEII